MKCDIKTKDGKQCSELGEYGNFLYDKDGKVLKQVTVCFEHHQQKIIQAALYIFNMNGLVVIPKELASQFGLSKQEGVKSPE